MTRFTHRRIRNFLLTLLALAAVWTWARAADQSLNHSAFITGYLLFGAITFLALYSLRKRLAFLSIGSATAWLEWHIYVGLATLAIFAMHAGLRIPNGILDITLAAVYLLTFTSGLIGLYLSRKIPRQLARVGQEVIYERIPALRRTVRRQADDAVLASVKTSGATTLADFYTAKLYDFFARPRRLWYQLRPTSAARKSLLHELQDIRRYLSDQEQGPCEQLFALVRRKDDLDFHEARQRLLKLWLFAHIALSYSLVLLALLHALLAHAFHGGAA